MKANRQESETQETNAANGAQRLLCPLCGSADAEFVLEKKISGSGGELPFRLWRCRACYLVRTEPQLTSDALEPFYRDNYWGGIRPADPDWIRRDQRDRTAFLARFRSQGAILDVGCGRGFFLRALDPKGWDRYGVEPMPVPYREASGALGADRITHAELAAAALPSGKFDVVTFWDSLEHLPNPRAELIEARRLLRPGGLILIGLPNFASYQARHFREDWYGLSLPHHLCHYTRGTLARLLESCGFRVRLVENRKGLENYHALKHSVLNRMTRLHGVRGGRLRYYALKPFLHPWDWISSLYGGGSSLQVCAEAVPREASGQGP